jgi:predicted ribosome quality control (RQC) complex YloA/Tae2 family protein
MERQPFRAFVTANGWRVLMGKSRTENDLLTHKTARGSDVFLHARDAPGAHVILVVEGERPGQELALQQAAQLAAHFSEARGHGVVDVRFTEVKHVKRVAGTPGLVTLAHERVKRVRLGDEAFAALLATEQGASTRLAEARKKR